MNVMRMKEFQMIKLVYRAPSTGLTSINIEYMNITSVWFVAGIAN